MEYDLKIVGGEIVDGTRAPRFRGDVGIRGNRIVALGKAPGAAARTIEADGRIVTPGFVDVHTHLDAQVFWDPMLSVSPWHGVTTAVIGNCGFGIAPTRVAHRELIVRTLEKVEGMGAAVVRTGLGDWGFETFPEYMDALDRRGTAINLGVLVGHTPVRLHTLGEAAAERAATEDEIRRMRTLVDEALAVGAIGFATSDYPHHYGFGGRPVPSRLAEYQETRTLTDALAKAPGSIFQSTLGPHLGFEQFGEIATRTNATVMWGGLLATQILVDVDHRAQLRAIEDMQARGIRFFPQVTPRPILFEFKFSDPFPLSMLLPFKGIDQQPRERQIAAYRDPAFRRAAAEAIAARDDIYRMAFVEAVISEDADASLDGRPAAEIARERGVPQLDLMLDLAVAGGLETRFRMPVANHDEAEAIRIVTSPSTLIALSDAGAHADQLCDACIPTYLLGRWVRDLGVMSLEDAIWKLAGQPAAIYGIAARGVLREGAFADVVVLDPATIAAGPLRRVRDLPAAGTRLVSDAVGIDAVIVNGTVIRRDGRDAIAPDDQMPGRLLRRGTSISA